MVATDSNSPSPRKQPAGFPRPASVKALLQYRVIYWAVRLGAAVMLPVVLFILLTFPPELQLFSVGSSMLLMCYFLILQFWVLPQVRTPLRVDLFAAALLLAPTIVSALTPFHEQQEYTGAVAVGLTVLASLCFVSHRLFVVWAVFSLALYVGCVFWSGQEVPIIYWISFLFVAPVLAFINRIVVQGNYDYLLERARQEDRLTSELACTTDELEVTRKFQEQSQHDLEERTLELTTVLRRAPIILSVIDRYGVYMQSRGLGLEKLGRKENELVGKSFQEIYADYPEVIAAYEQARSGQSSSVRVTFNPGGTHEIQYSPVFDQQSEITGVVGVGVDLSESVQAESKRVELELQLFRAQKMESLGVLASGVAHDFNNYLSAIIAFCDGLDFAGDNRKLSDNQQVVGEIKKVAENAAGICEQMLMFAGKSTRDKQTFDLNSMLAENKKFLGAIVAKHVELKFNLSSKPLPIRANKLLIQQAIVNLVKNSSDALQGFPDGRVIVSTESMRDLPPPQQVNRNTIQIGELPTDRAESLVYLTVKDNGPGIEENRVNRIFEPYYSSKDTGHGFGLAITAGIMQHHGGVIACQTGLGGTRMDLVFELDNIGTNVMANKLPGDSRDGGSEHCKILLVDDETMIVRSVTMAFEALGFDVVTAESADEAIELAKQHGAFDCLVLDYSMPKMNGLELLRALRKDGITCPAILCSGYLELPEYEDAVPEATLRKPYSIATLRNTIEELCTAAEQKTIN